MNGLPIFNEIHEELDKVERKLKSCVDTKQYLLAEASSHLLKGKGKRLRPAFVLLSGKSCGGCLERLIPLAASLELIHMATLVHDDVVDSSLTRRGIPTVKARWGNRISLHAGDYLFAKSLVLLSNYKDPRVAGTLARVSVEMCRGEIQQITTAFKIDQSPRDYFKRIKRKTALLLSASCELGALVAGARDYITRSMGRYGYYIGMAFQITDDILDIIADEQQLGKPAGSDLEQGIITLPTIFALSRAKNNSDFQQLLVKTTKTRSEIRELIEIIKNTGAIEDSFNIVEKYVRKAKSNLAPIKRNSSRDVLYVVADFIRERSF